MSLNQYHPDVQLYLAGFANVYRHPKGRWVAELEPNMVPYDGGGPLPPGQAIRANVSRGLYEGYFAGDWAASASIDDDPPRRANSGDWGSYPLFGSAETAWACVMGFLNHQRPDLVAGATAMAEEAARLKHKSERA